MERIIEETELARFRDRCDLIIDARSPAEFAEDHMAGARNVPMLDDAQRAEIGTLHRESPFEARKRGAIYALQAIERFLESEPMMRATRKMSFMIYCARGGQRSGAIASVLSQIGFSIFRLARGYKTYRAFVRARLQTPLPGGVRVLYGYTGSLKTAILERLHTRVNVIDLEGCARHRGSLLGDLPGIPQPTQRGFETALVSELDALLPERPTLLEGESRKIGTVSIPNGIWDQMRAAEPIWLEIPRAVRTRNILEGYREYKQADLMDARLGKLDRYLSRQTVAAMRADLVAGDWAGLVDKLLEHHYDPLYRRAAERAAVRIEATSLDEAVEKVACALGISVGP